MRKLIIECLEEVGISLDKELVCTGQDLNLQEYIIDSINAGIYYIHEDSAPTGYKKTKDVKIEVKPVSEKQSFSIYNEC